MIPDNIADELAVIYGEKPVQDPLPPAEENTPMDPVQVTTFGDTVVDAAPLSAPEKADAITMATGGVSPNGEYQVLPGETLQSIAIKLYSDVTKANVILALNQTAGRLINENLSINGLILLP